MKQPRHVSVLDLDAWFASTKTERESANGREIAAHLAACVHCRRHIEAMGEDALPPLPARIPPSGTRHRAPRRLLPRLVPAALTVLAVAASLALYLRSRNTIDEASYVGVKGAPAVQVLVRREGHVRVWDGVSPVRSGDALAVRVACESFGHVVVAADGASGITRAWDGACPGSSSDTTLPFTLVVDAEPGREHFSVVLSRQRLDDARLEAAVRGSTRGAEAWTMAFDFAKEE
jgi:hypothetical protein